MTSKYDYPCERAQYGEPSCYDWLLGESDQPPDHVCGWAQALSKSQFADWWTARQEPLLDVNVSVYYSQHLYDWPAPLGYKALREWYFRRHPLENPEWLERQGGDGSLLAQFLSEQTQDTTPLPLWLLKPVLSRDDVWLALAAPRRTKAGQLWFLGLVEGEFVEGEGGSFWTGEDDKLGVQRFELFPEPYTHSALEADENASLSGAVSMWSKQGQRHYVLSIYSWEYVEPAVLIEAYPSKPGELVKLAAEADKLFKWYNATLLGKEFKTRGAVNAHDAPADFIQELVTKLERLSKGTTRITRKLVAQQMGIEEVTLKDKLRRLGLTWKDARRLGFLQDYSPPSEWPVAYWRLRRKR